VNLIISWPTENGEVLVWGCGHAGRLGLGDAEDCFYPTRVFLEQGGTQPHVTHVSCGYKHTAVCADGDVYIWGLTDNSRLGLEKGHDREVKQPQLLGALSATSSMLAVQCGANHSLGLTGTVASRSNSQEVSVL
jgi:alpha-tubulin suppressor-like RCC1 family protein